MNAKAVSAKNEPRRCNAKSAEAQTPAAKHEINAVCGPPELARIEARDHCSPMVESTKTAKSLFWSGVENGGLALVSLVGLVLYSRLLSPADFGLFSVTLSLFELCSLLVTMTFHDALIQYRSAENIHFDSAFTVTMAISVLLVALSLLCAPLFESVTKVQGAGAIFFAVSLSYPALAASSTIVARQRRNLDFRALALRSLGGRISGAIFGLVAALYGLGVWSLVIQQICTSFIGSLVLWLATNEKPRLRINMGSLSEIAHFGLISTSNLVLSFSAKRLFVFIAGIQIGFVGAGYLNIAFRIVDMLWSILATAVTQVSLPMLAKLRHDGERLSRAYQKSISFACLFLFPCFVGIALVAPELIDLLFGQRWSPAAPGVSLLALLAVVQTPRLFVNPLLTALGRPRDVLVAVGFELAVMLTLMSLLRLTDYRFALALWVFCECIQIPVSTFMLRRATGYGLMEQFKAAMKPLLAAIVMACVVESCRHLAPSGSNDLQKFTLMAAAGAATYVGVIFLIDNSAARSLIEFFATAFGVANWTKKTR